MPCDFFTLPHTDIQTLIPYQPGKSIASLQTELGLSDVIKMASNENALGCSPNVLTALRQLDAHTVATYPAPHHHPLHQALTEHLDIAPEQLLLGNGSDTFFSLLMTTFALHTDRHILTHEYAFNAYTIQAQALGIPAQITPVHADWSVDIDAMIKAVTPQTAVVFIASPNNPTGLAIPQDKIKRLLRHLPETTLLALDEAYLEYHPENENTIDWLASFPNLVLLRTFSKAYGLAGLRIGYAIAHADLIQILQRVQLPFTVNQAALDAALAALSDNAFLQQTVNMTRAGKTQLLAGFQNLSLTSLPSTGNFITVDCQRPALAIYQALLHHGIIVRPLAPYGLPEHLRITIGTEVQNARLLTALATCL